MAKKDFIFSVTTLAGCKYSILKDLEKTLSSGESIQDEVSAVEAGQPGNHRACLL